MIDVLIVGAGPTGLTLACELARRGVSFRLIDKRPERLMISKAAGIMPRSLEVFENMGVVDEFLKAGVPCGRITVYARDRRILNIRLDDLDTPFPMVLGLPQYETERILEEHLDRLHGAIQRSCELKQLAQDNRCVTATVARADGTEETILARYLVGCDGAHSVVRKQLGMPFPGSMFHKNYIVAHLAIDWEMPRDESFEFHSPTGTIAGTPLPENTWSVGMELDDTQWKFDHPPAPPREELQRLFNERSPIPAKLPDPLWSSYYRIHQRQVPSYRQGRTFLAGDAAHIHSPAGGQGMNTGIQDAYNLAWKLAHVCQAVAPAAILDSYHAERHPVGQATIKLATSLQTELDRRNCCTMAVRDTVTGLAGRTKTAQELMACRLGELCYHYRRSPIVSEFRSGRIRWSHHACFSDFRDCVDFCAAPCAGDRAVDAMLTTGPEHVPSAHVRMYDLLRGKGHKLFLFAGLHGDKSADDGWSKLRRVAGNASSQYGDRLKTYVVLPRFHAPRFVDYDGPVVFDGEATLHHRYGAGGPCLYVIRPDGYIGYRADEIDGERLTEYLAKILVPRRTRKKQSTRAEAMIAAG